MHMNATNFDDLVSVREAAGLLRVSESTVWRWINTGAMPSYRVGRKRVYLRRADLAPRRRTVHRADGNDRTAQSGDSVAEETLARAAALIERVRALHDKQRATPGWGQLKEAWEDINDARDQRAEQLDLTLP